MAPTDANSAEASRYLSSGKKEKEGGEGRDHPNSNLNPGSSEEVHWNSHEENEHPHEEDDNNDHHSHHQRLPQRHRRPQPRSNNMNSSDPMIPQMKYAKADILHPNSVPDYRGGGGGEPPGDPMLYHPPKATSQYQLHPNVNSNTYNGNGNGPPPHQLPHNHPPYMNNGGLPPHYYPHPYGQQNYPPYYDPNGQYYVTSNATTSGLNVRGEEVGIVVVVLLLWVGAIILFFNRWGKIRMLEPYQPKFCENHRPSCPMAEVTAISTHPRSFSKFNISTEMLAGSPHFVKCNYHGIPASDPAPGFSGLTIPGAGFPSGGSTGMLSNHRNSVMMNHHHHHHHRPRQNSVFVTSPSSQVSFYGSDNTLQSASRKTKSAVDLPTLVLTGEFVDNSRRNSKNSITQL